MDINIGVGINNLILGLSFDRVVSILGQPDKGYIEEFTGDKIYYFNAFMYRLTFTSGNENFLNEIEVFHPKLRLFGKEVYNYSREKLKKELVNQGYNEIEEEEYDTFDYVYCERLNLSFYFEFDRLTSIKILQLL